jgi:hypothetical protein
MTTTAHLPHPPRSSRNRSRAAVAALALATLGGCVLETITPQRTGAPPIPPGLRNLARDPGTEVTAQSTFPGYAPRRAIDGDTTITVGPEYSWANDMGAAGHLPQALQVSLAEPRRIQAIYLYTSAGYELRDYDIEAWDGAAWHLVVQQRDNRQTVVTHTLAAPLVASKVRVTCLAGPANQANYGRVNELEILGDTATP